MLTRDARRTTDDDGRQPIAIGHLSDSGDLKTFTFLIYFQMAVIALIYSSAKSTYAKPCELQTALDFIYLKDSTHSCKYNAIKEMSDGLLTLGIFMLCWNTLRLVLTTCIHWKKIGKIKRTIAVITVSLI